MAVLWTVPSSQSSAEVDTPAEDETRIADHVARAKAGDAEAFAFLYRRYLDAIYRFALLRLADRAAAEDATQTVFLRALAALPSCREDAAFAGWLFAIARSVVTDRLRARRFQAGPLETLAVESDAMSGPEALALRGEASRQLYEARSRCLNARERDLFDLLLTDLNDKEIAQVLGRTHGATRTAHWRLLTKLRDCLGAGERSGDHG